MTAKRDPKDVADSLAGNIDYMRTLLGAAGDKVIFYLENKKLLGPYGELLYGCALELENLLSLAERFLERMDGEMETATELLYSIDWPCETQ